MDFILLLAGLAGLWFGTEIAIRGAVSIANRLRVPEFIIGVGILSIGSDLPELAIAVDAAIKIRAGTDVSDVIVGSALGSSLGQIGFVLGFVGLLSYLTLPKQIVYRHGSILLGSALLLALFGYDGIVTRNEGVALLVFYGVYLVALLTEVRGPNEGEDVRDVAMARAIVYLLVGLAIVVVSADVTVDSAVAVARVLGVSESFVAIVIIGLGSSLPELSISIGAVMKGHHRMSVGNLIGSNIFDTLVPIGAAALIAPLGFSENLLLYELPFLFVLSALVLYFFQHRRGIQRYEAVTVLGLYCGYVALKLSDLIG